MIRTGIAIGMAGLGTLTAGALIANEPKPSHEQPITTPRFVALGLGMGGTLTGVITSLTVPGRSLKPLGGVLAAAAGGMLIGQQVGRLFGDR